jgi:argininosuccinate synthase
MECGIIEDPWVSPPHDAYEWTVAPENAPDEPDVFTLSFESGTPVTIDGVGGSPAEIIGQIARRAGAHGVGRIDMIEDRLIGIKSREIYEVPGAVTLITAHRDLEDLTLERSLGSFKRGMEPVYADLVYNGLWYSPLRRALDAFIVDSQRPVTGDVRLRLYRGVVTVEGRRSPEALYEHGLATYEAGDRFDHDAAAGFVKLWGLPLKVWSERQGEGR